MIYNLYSIYDKVAETFGSPSMYASDALCMRDLSFICESDKKFAGMASDLELMCIGTFNAINGEIVGCNRRLVCRVSDLVKKDGE